MLVAGHGPNIGHGYVKYIIIDKDGRELEPIVFAAQMAQASGPVRGALTQTRQVDLNGVWYWTGDDADQAVSARTILSQDRLVDLAFIPALVAGAVARFGHLNGSSTGVCVSGLPATWAEDPDKCRMLGQRLRAGTPPEMYRKVTIIAEPLGLAYSQLLDNDGQIVGNPDWQQKRIGVVDLGHLTVDRSELLRLAPIRSAMDTAPLGTKGPLGQIRAHLVAHFDREFTLAETDAAVRARSVRIAGRDTPLPMHWDRPLIENGQANATRLTEAWSRGAQFEAILVGGGGAELEPITAAIRAVFPAGLVEVAADPQLAIARGYAKLARRQAAAL